MSYLLCKYPEARKLSRYLWQKWKSRSAGAIPIARRAVWRLKKGGGTLALVLLLCVVVLQTGCRSTSEHREDADKVASEIVAGKQEEASVRPEIYGILR